jgi:hypothetical protein
MPGQRAKNKILIMGSRWAIVAAPFTPADGVVFNRPGFYLKGLMMAETNGSTYWNGCDPCAASNWQTMFHGADSMRREFSFNSQSLRDHIDSNRNSMDAHFSSLSAQAEHIGGGLGVAIEKIAAASQLQGAQNTASILAALAACCCDVKEKIASDGQQTRDLINGIERERLAVQTHQLQAELLAIKYSHGHGNGNGS